MLWSRVTTSIQISIMYNLKENNKIKGFIQIMQGILIFFLCFSFQAPEVATMETNDTIYIRLIRK